MATAPLILIHWGSEIVFLNRNELPEKNLSFFVADLILNHFDKLSACLEIIEGTCWAEVLFRIT